ncbi:structural maintenance of chromosomes protein 5 [Anthonomus grandis grandis]|uniref:structural maintenance of chromosomes protein 5 n=1 Tax=Anthonomus grandis grandis TaxID=2921223 RepID=UPI00216618F4|nr:structural maintenance of chromosomes protein 5 [Anthonomus grandis grandis]
MSFKPGSIVKIQVENFVTYSYVEMYPGPNLNMIIGPNGTGKSTMVAAIILGLGGNPKTVGRGTRVSEYVKHECDHAKINIFLQGHQQNSFIKITREFNTQEKSNWKLNNKSCRFAEVEECIQQFNIQVDNLCQFLPQDRVADFAKLNKQDLLRETMRALCRHDLIEKQDALIEAREQHKNLTQQAGKHGQTLQEAQNDVLRLEGRVKNFNKVLKYKERITDIDRKIAWSEYEEKRLKLSEIKADKLQAQQIVDKHKSEIKPIEQHINLHKETLNGIQRSNSEVVQSIRKQEEHINTTTEKIESLSDKVRKIEDEMQLKLEENNQWDKQIEEVVAKLEDMKKAHHSLSAKMNQGVEKKAAILTEVSNDTNRIRQLQDQKEQIEQVVSENNAEIRALRNEQERIENIKEQRFEKLRRTNNDAYTAVHWLRNNGHLFKGEIFEPIMLELNVLDNSKAKYVESLIPMRDRLAFTCTDKGDMNLLIQSLRHHQKLSINVVYAGPPNEKYNQPNVPIERLRKYGFYTYVSALISAPVPIMRYLCRTYKLHNIPVGDKTTNNCYESVPQEISVFFSDTFRYAIMRSKYSNQTSTRQNEVTGDGGLSLSLDVIRLENVKGRCNDMKRKLEGLQTQIENYNVQISKLEEKIKANKEKVLEMQKQKQHIDALKNKIASSQHNLTQMRDNKKSPEEIRREARVKMKKLVQTMGLLQETLKNYFKELESLITTANLNSSKIEILRQKIEYMENQIVDSKRLIHEAQETLSLVTDRYNAAIQEAKNQLQKAKSLSGGFTPADQQFDQYREAYERLGNNLEELVAEKENLISRIDCLNTADDQEIQEYEDRVNLIEKLTSNIEGLNVQINKLSVKMDRMQVEWLTPLNDLVAGINLRFGSAFERMGCAGEVTICPGDNDKNYADYSLSIKVTYRNGEPLQELNSTIQSGGERAVATAAFMLALQELTPVPFRCVDEINQGMDANNERRIFELIVETTSQPETSQYFLITPKLVPNLNYSRQLLVHIVHNGPMINADQKWSASKFCNPNRLQVQ